MFDLFALVRELSKVVLIQFVAQVFTDYAVENEIKRIRIFWQEFARAEERIVVNAPLSY